MKSAIGLDISDHTIEVVELKKSGKKAKILAYNRVSLLPGIVEKGKVKKPQELGAILKQLFAQAKPKAIKPKRVIFGLPESQVYTHAFRLSELSEKEIRAALPNAIQKVVPIKKDDLLFSYRLLQANKQNTDVFVIAASKTIVNGWLRCFRKHDINVETFDIESMAIFRGLGLDIKQQTVCLVDIGSQTTNISLFQKNGLIYNQTSHIAGDAFTKAIVDAQAKGQKTANISLDEAENIKVTHGLNYSDQSAKQALQTSVDKLAKHIQETIAYVESKRGGAVAYIVLAGGSSDMIGLRECLAAKTGKEIYAGVSHLLDKGINIKYLEAIGLAWRGVNKTEFKQDLSISIETTAPTEIKKSKQKTGTRTKERTEDLVTSDDSISSKAKKQIFLLVTILILGALFLIFAFWYRGDAAEKRKKAQQAAEESLESIPVTTILQEDLEQVTEDSNPDPQGQPDEEEVTIERPSNIRWIEISPQGDKEIVSAHKLPDSASDVVREIRLGTAFLVVEENTSTGWVLLDIDNDIYGWVLSSQTKIIPEDQVNLGE